jgi:hypothetical protein
MKPLKETKLGIWLKEKAPHVLDVVGNVLPDKGVLGIIKNIVSKDSSIPPEQKLEFEKLVADHEKEMYALEIDDRKDARKMYTSNSQLQKIFAITFLIGYLVVTFAAGWMIYIIAVKQIHLPDWAIGFVGTVWGGMSTKVATICDFLFGSSYRHEPEQNPIAKGR